MKNLLKQLAGGIALLLVMGSGCVTLERSAPERHYFAIELPPSAARSASTNGLVLSVANLRISPRYADRSFVYRTSDAGYESDFYNQFLTSPDRMISEELRKGLAASQEFKYVLGPADMQQPNYVLEGSVDTLYGDFRNPNQPAAVLGIDFFLYKEHSDNSGIVIQKRYRKSVPLTTKSPEALVEGWDRGLQEIVTSLVVDLKAANLAGQNSALPVSPDKDKSDAAANR